MGVHCMLLCYYIRDLRLDVSERRCVPDFITVRLLSVRPHATRLEDVSRRNLGIQYDDALCNMVCHTTTPLVRR